MASKSIYICKNEIAEEVRPYRLQYSVKEAAYMLDTSEDTVVRWCKDFDCPLYKIGGKGKNYVKHDDLVDLIERSSRCVEFAEEVLGK